MLEAHSKSQLSMRSDTDRKYLSMLVLLPTALPPLSILGLVNQWNSVIISQNHPHKDSASHFEVQLHSLADLFNASTRFFRYPLELVGSKVHQEHGHPGIIAQ